MKFEINSKVAHKGKIHDRREMKPEKIMKCKHKFVIIKFYNKLPTISNCGVLFYCEKCGALKLKIDDHSEKEILSNMVSMWKKENYLKEERWEHYC